MGNTPSNVIGLSGQKKTGSPDDFIKACKEGRVEAVCYIIDNYKDTELDTSNIVKRGLTEAILENHYSVVNEIIKKREQWTGGSDFSSNDKCVFGGFFTGSSIPISVHTAIEQEGYISFLSLSLIQGVQGRNLECAKILIPFAKTGIRHEISSFLTYFRSIVFLNKGVEIDPSSMMEAKGYGSSYASWSILLGSEHMTEDDAGVLIGSIQGHYKQDIFLVRFVSEDCSEIIRKVLSKVCLPNLLGFEARHLIRLPVNYSAKQDSSFETYLPNKRERRPFECSVLSAFLSCPFIKVNRDDPSGHTLLHYACFLGYVDMVKVLLDNNETDVNALDHDLLTPLFYSYKSGHKEIVSLLIKDERIDNKHACQILLQDDLTKRSSYLRDGKRYFNPLCMASMNGRMSMVDLLLEKQQPHYFDAYSLKTPESKSAQLCPLFFSIRYNRVHIADRILTAYQKRFNSIQKALDKSMEVTDKNSYYYGKYGAVSLACHEKNLNMLDLLLEHIELNRMGQWNDAITNHLFVAPLLVNYGWDWIGDTQTNADKINQCVIVMGHERVVRTRIEKLDRIAEYLPIIEKTQGVAWFSPLLDIINKPLSLSLKNEKLRKLAEKTCPGADIDLVTYMVHGGSAPLLYTIEKCTAVLFLLAEKADSCSVFGARCIHVIKKLIQSAGIESIVSLLGILSEYLELVEDQTSVIHSLHSYCTHYIMHQAKKGREQFLSCIDKTCMKHHIERHQKLLLLSEREPSLDISMSARLPEKGLADLYNDEETHDTKITIQDPKQGTRIVFLHKQVLASSVPILCSRIEEKPNKVFSENILYMLKFSYGVVEEIPEEIIRVLQVLSSKYHFKKFSDYLNDCDNERIARVTQKHSNIPLETRSDFFRNIDL